MAANNNNNALLQPQVSRSGGDDQSWFVGAPVTMLIVITTVVSHILYVQTTSSTKNHNQYNSNNNSLPYRILFSRLTFETTGELVVGTMLLLFLSRKLEREMSSQQYMAWLTFTIAISTILLEGMRIVLNILVGMEFDNEINHVGPYPLLGALFYYYHVYKPRLYPRFVSFLGLAFSEKSLFYGWFFYVVCSNNFKSSILPAMCGAITGAILIASSQSSSSSSIISPFIGWFSSLDRLLRRHVQAPPRVLVTTAVAPQQRRQRQQQRGGGGRGGGQQQQHAAARDAGGGGGGGNNNNNVPRRRAVVPTAPPEPYPAAAAMAAAAAAAAVVEPDPDALEQLINMGFERQRIIQALRSTNNDVQRAADRLLQES